MKLQALADKVIVRQEYEKEINGILIPKTARKHQLYDGSIKYIVVSVGPEYPYDLKEGDEVIVRKHEGKKILSQSEEYLVLKERWVEAVCI